MHRGRRLADRRPEERARSTAVDGRDQRFVDTLGVGDDRSSTTAWSRRSWPSRASTTSRSTCTRSGRRAERAGATCAVAAGHAPAPRGPRRHAAGRADRARRDGGRSSAAASRRPRPARRSRTRAPTSSAAWPTRCATLAAPISQAALRGALPDTDDYSVARPRLHGRVRRRGAAHHGHEHGDRAGRRPAALDPRGQRHRGGAVDVSRGARHDPRALPAPPVGGRARQALRRRRRRARRRARRQDLPARPGPARARARRRRRGARPAAPAALPLPGGPAARLACARLRGCCRDADLDGRPRTPAAARPARDAFAVPTGLRGPAARASRPREAALLRGRWQRAAAWDDAIARRTGALRPSLASPRGRASSTAHADDRFWHRRGCLPTSRRAARDDRAAARRGPARARGEPVPAQGARPGHRAATATVFRVVRGGLEPVTVTVRVVGAATAPCGRWSSTSTPGYGVAFAGIVPDGEESALRERRPRHARRRRASHATPTRSAGRLRGRGSRAVPRLHPRRPRRTGPRRSSSPSRSPRRSSPTGVVPARGGPAGSGDRWRSASRAGRSSCGRRTTAATARPPPTSDGARASTPACSTSRSSRRAAEPAGAVGFAWQEREPFALTLWIPQRFPALDVEGESRSASACASFARPPPRRRRPRLRQVRRRPLEPRRRPPARPRLHRRTRMVVVGTSLWPRRRADHLTTTQRSYACHS